MADGDIQLVQGGKRLLDSSGKLLKTCCCGSACAECNVLPLDYDLTFTGINVCPGSPPFTVHQPVPANSGRAPWLGSGSSGCSWALDVSGSLYTSTMSVVIGHPFDGGIGYGETSNNTYFSADFNPYGPDCSATMSGSNVLTNPANCDTVTPGAFFIQAGYGGSATAVPVMPP